MVRPYGTWERANGSVYRGFVERKTKDLALPALRVPPPDAPIRVLLGYLVRRWWAKVKPWGRWTTVRDTGINVYQQHRDGRRRVLSAPQGYQPLDREWLAGSDWQSKPRLTKEKIP